jgi:hypothetical protein
MSRYEGYWISPDSSMVAFEQVDESCVPKYRIMHQGSDRVGDGQQATPAPAAARAYTRATAVRVRVRMRGSS